MNNTTAQPSEVANNVHNNHWTLDGLLSPVAAEMKKETAQAEANQEAPSSHEPRPVSRRTSSFKRFHAIASTPMS